MLCNPLFLLSSSLMIVILTITGNVSETLDENDSTPAAKLSAYEKYRDFSILKSSNFSSQVFRQKDAWIVIFHDGDLIATGWKTMAASLRGMVWVGLVDKSQEFELLSQLGFESDLPAAVVYPYGTKKTKQVHALSVATPIEAKNKVLNSIGDPMYSIGGADIQDFFMDSFASVPTKFPTVVISMNSSPDAVFKCLALRFQRYFNFRKMVNPSNDDLSALGLQNVYFDMPSFAVLVTTDPLNPKVNAIFYSEEDMGQMNYPNLLRFLFHVNAEYRYLLPGDSMSDDSTVAQMLDVREIEEQRFDFRDGSITSGVETNKHTEL